MIRLPIRAGRASLGVAMGFMDLTPRRRQARWGDHPAILATVAASLVASGRADDAATGPARVADAVGFTTLFLALGNLLARLPAIWTRTRRSASAGLVTPAFVGLSLTYFYLGFRAYFVQPGATGPVFLRQLLVLIGLSAGRQLALE